MASEQSVIPVERIEWAIFLIRAQKVILDKDLAILYQVPTSNLNKAVSRNLDRFPEDFMFQLTEEEFKNLKFHFGTSSWGGIINRLPCFKKVGRSTRDLFQKEVIHAENEKSKWENSVLLYHCRPQ